MGKYNTYTVEFEVEVMKFTEQNGNRAAQWEFIVNGAHIRYWCKQKETLCKVKGSVRVFWGPKTGKFDELEDTTI
jgi:hypothetical protein